MSNILDDLSKIRELDSRNMLGSIEALGKQMEEIYRQFRTFKLPPAYKKFNSVAVLGMGGSALGAHLIKSVFKDELSAPVEIINDYQISAWVGKDTLVIASSYSGNTEETLAAAAEAKIAGAKIVVISAGGKLGEWAKKNKIPALIFSTRNNPCGSPRMGLGYSIVGQMLILSKAGIINANEEKIKTMVRVVENIEGSYKTDCHPRENGDPAIGHLDSRLRGNDTRSGIRDEAKSLAKKLIGYSVWFVGAEHLAGNAHIVANQMNENAKRFAGYFLIPEMNHHLLEGMLYPAGNRNSVAVVFLESKLYAEKIQKRFAVSKEILDKNNIKHLSYQCREKTKLAQAMEILALGSYVSYYSALLEGIDPTAIPFVDFFKKRVGEKG